MAKDREKAFVLWFDELRRADVALVGVIVSPRVN